MNKAQKADEIKELEALFQAAKLVVLAEYKSVNVESISNYRRQIRSAKGSVKVAKNSLVRRVVDKEKVGPFYGLLKGQNALTFANEDPVEVVKKIVDFVKENPNFKLKGGVLGNSHLSEEKLKDLAKLPGKEVLTAMLLGALNGPIGSVMGVMDSNTSSFLNLLKGIEEKMAKESGASTSA